MRTKSPLFTISVTTAGSLHTKRSRNQCMSSSSDFMDASRNACNASHGMLKDLSTHLSILCHAYIAIRILDAAHRLQIMHMTALKVLMRSKQTCSTAAQGIKSGEMHMRPKSIQRQAKKQAVVLKFVASRTCSTFEGWVACAL